jgi:hypothetical protein
MPRARIAGEFKSVVRAAKKCCRSTYQPALPCPMLVKWEIPTWSKASQIASLFLSVERHHATAQSFPSSLSASVIPRSNSASSLSPKSWYSRAQISCASSIDASKVANESTSLSRMLVGTSTLDRDWLGESSRTPKTIEVRKTISEVIPRCLTCDIERFRSLIVRLRRSVAYRQTVHIRSGWIPILKKYPRAGSNCRPVV